MDMMLRIRRALWMYAMRTSRKLWNTRRNYFASSTSNPMSFKSDWPGKQNRREAQYQRLQRSAGTHPKSLSEPNFEVRQAVTVRQCKRELFVYFRDAMQSVGADHLNASDPCSLDQPILCSLDSGDRL